MPLTSAQLQSLKTDILADPVLSGHPNTPDGNFAIAAAYNTQASPNWTVWRTSVSAQQVMENGFIWTTVDTLTVGKARIWDWMTRYGDFNPSKTNVRQGLADCFGGASAQVTALLPHCKMLASRCQKLFSAGTGSDAQPATMAANVDQNFTLSYQDVEAARNLP